MVYKKNVCFLLFILIVFMSIRFVSAQSGVTLDFLDPASGPPGTEVRIAGQGFSTSGNIVIFRSIEDPVWFDMSTELPSNGQSITFRVPFSLRLACHYDQNPCGAPNLVTLPGEYEVYIGTINTVESNILLFSVPPKTGDVNEDTVVDIVDALLVAQYYVDLNPPGLTNLVGSDVNCDDGINIIDALLIAQYYVGIITEFSVCEPIQTPEPTNEPCLPCGMIVNGYVTDITGTPIEGANIHYFDDSTPPKAITDVSGYYEFTGQSGEGLCPVSDRSLYVDAEGFQPETRWIVEHCGTVTNDFILTPVP